MEWRADFDAIISQAPEEMFITAAAWERTMEANKAFADLRPDPSVRVDRDACGDLVDEALRATAVLREHDLLIAADEQPMKLALGMIFPSVMYVEFDALMRIMTEMTVRVLKILDSMKGLEPVVFLALPNLRFDKSNAWFLLSLWHPSLRRRTGGVVGNGETAQRLLQALQKRQPTRQFALCVLYVDDMAYSGGQIHNFLRHPFSPSHREYFFPIIPFVTPQVLSQGERLGIRYDLTHPQVIAPPANHLEQYTIRKYTRDVNGRTALGERYWKTTSLSDKPGSTRIAFDDLLNKMEGLVHVTEETKFLYRANRAVFDALCTFYRLSEIFKPCIVFEHKVADNVSVSSRLLAFPAIDDAPFPVNTAPSLVNVTGPLEKGSRSFYKGLVWKETPTNARFQSCLVCANPASFRCYRCKRASYCGHACQTAHWNAVHESNCLSS